MFSLINHLETILIHEIWTRVHFIDIEISNAMQRNAYNSEAWTQKGML